jgi:hypothetical protein
MIAFEQEVKNYFTEKDIAYEDHSGSLEKLDFSFGDKSSKRHFSFDVKEKRQQYNMKNWQTQIPSQHLFILDDLAARKMLAYAPNSGMVIRDNLRHLYFFFSIVDLFLMPKIRINRVIEKKVRGFKGKWLIDLRNGIQCAALDEVFQQIHQYLDRRKEIFTNIHECYGSYQGEAIVEQGIVRQPGHWQIDVNETR